MKPIIEVQGISKKYRINANQQQYLSLRDSITDFFKFKGGSEKEDFWALKDVNFTVEAGESVGIIGRNGAGKSTLLKILSRITPPTKGHVILRGRIASLLEVGTGFHPELTGRENVYFNGSILGLRKAEIDRKFDEIIDFSGVEQFIDTPLKHYSSGMKLRLAFSVAAHLEPEILIIDEVLAVGDAEFQKKCLGKMDDVSKSGRTVLFVSHNLEAISTLTHKCIFLKQGAVFSYTNTLNAINTYLTDLSKSDLVYFASAKEDIPCITKVEVITSLPNNVQESGKELVILFEIYMPMVLTDMALSFQIKDLTNRNIIHSWIFDREQPILRKKGMNIVKSVFPTINLYMGKYNLSVHFAQFGNPNKFATVLDICPFEVVLYGKQRDYPWSNDACVYFENVIFHEL
jgi:lipopolysaccharide transport system ATP-binding protein